MHKNGEKGGYTQNVFSDLSVCYRYHTGFALTSLTN